MSRKVKKQTVPTRVLRVVNYCRAGQVVCMMKRRSEVGDEKVFWLEPSGRSVGEWTLNKAIELGLLIPQNDALFPELGAQTYRAAP